jgi:hypothetical protein
MGARSLGPSDESASPNLNRNRNPGKARARPPRRGILVNPISAPWRGCGRFLRRSSTMRAAPRRRKTMDIRFPEQWFRLETGLAYNWHRHYVVTLGR